MGQYYVIANVDKRQQMLPFDYDNGMKLLEWSYERNRMVMALMNLLSGEWKGDRVYVVGDYADLSVPDEPYCTALRKAMGELGIGDDDCLHSFACEKFRRVLPEEEIKLDWPFDDSSYAPPADLKVSTEDRGYRYIYNHATRQVIDLKHCPIEEQSGESVMKIAPLPLLLAMGNGRGGGDYQRGHTGYELVGSWCETVTSIEVTKEPLASASDYTEFAPDFTENDPLIPWTNEVAESEAYKNDPDTMLIGEKMVAFADDDIDDIMCTALEGGITHWCFKVEVIGELLGDYASEQISGGGTLHLLDDDGTVYVLTREKFVEGLRKFLSEDNDYDCLFLEDDGSYSLDTCQIDAIAADIIVQYAVFDGELVFG